MRENGIDRPTTLTAILMNTSKCHRSTANRLDHESLLRLHPAHDAVYQVRVILLYPCSTIKCDHDHHSVDHLLDSLNLGHSQHRGT